MTLLSFKACWLFLVMLQLKIRASSFFKDNREPWSMCSYNDFNKNLQVFEYVYEEDSTYQSITFMEAPEYGDKCLDLDDIIQICTSYRPHYHENFVHFPAAYMKDIKRVAFIGGGDSMLLHEVLKYPSIELVLGLELDQKVVRGSFKYLQTQPHFDDERVEWIFGDAAKSIMVLPKEYFGTFDLVLVDVSETVMSFSVSDQLNILEALSLLLKPDGVFVKNELYFKKLSELFKYTVQLHQHDTPIICEQEWSMGSNAIDFLHPNFDLLRENNIETLLYKPLENENYHLNLIQDYSNNADNIVDKICLLSEKHASSSNSSSQSAGILTVIEAENASENKLSRDDLSDVFTESIQKAGLTSVSKLSYESKENGSTLVIVAREGIITANTWPSNQYCALDLHLWGAYDKLETVKSALLQAVGNDGTVSSYKFVLGGIVSDNKDEESTIDPSFIRPYDCPIQTGNNHTETETVLDIFIDEISKIQLLAEKTHAVVFCENYNCKIQERLLHNIADQVSIIYICGESDDEASGTVLQGYYSLCDEQNNLSNLFEEIVEKHGVVNKLIFDIGLHTLRLNKLFEDLYSDSSLQRYFESEFLVLDHGFAEAELSDWNEYKGLLTIFNEVTWSATIIFGEFELGVAASNLPTFVSQLVELIDRIHNRTGVECVVKNVNRRGATLAKRFNPHYYQLEDYDLWPSFEQHIHQRPIAAQSLFQIHTKDPIHDENKPVSMILKDAISESLTIMGLQSIQVKSMLLGHGAVFTGVFSKGHIYLVYDGKNSIDVNIFTSSSEKIDHEAEFLAHLLKMLPWRSSRVVLKEDHPRGFGRTINYADEVRSDFTAECFDKYEQCLDYAELGECEALDVRSFMMNNCPHACNWCENSSTENVSAA